MSGVIKGLQMVLSDFLNYLLTFQEKSICRGEAGGKSRAD